MSLRFHLVIALLLAGVVQAQVVDRMVAVVNKHVILESELDQAVKDNKLPADLAIPLKANLGKEIEMSMSIVRTGAGMLIGPDMRSVRIFQIPKTPGQ